MAFTPALLATLTKQTLALLNASSAYAATSDDDKFTTNEVSEEVFEGDERTFTAVAETKEHWARVDIMAESSDLTTQGQEIPSHIGDIGEVTIKFVSTDSDYKLGNRATRKEIEIAQRNTDSTFTAGHASSGTVTAGYYDPVALADGIAYFTGYAMKVRIATYARTAALQSPEAYASLIVAHALSRLFSKDGLDPQLAQYYSREADKLEATVRRNATTLPENKQMEEALAA